MKFYKWSEKNGKVEAVSVTWNGPTVIIEGGTIRSFSPVETKRFDTSMDAKKYYDTICGILVATGFRTFGGISPRNCIGEEYYLPKQELINRITNQLKSKEDKDMKYINSEALVARASNGKFKTIAIYYNEGEILSYSGYLEGKKQLHRRSVSSPKQGRTQLEQALLEYNSIINSYKDRGYKTFTSIGVDTTLNTDALIARLNSKLPKNNTDASGNIKPMLAKPYDKVKSKNFPYIAQKKLNGVRCLIFRDCMDIVAISRKGKDYNAATTHIRKELEPMFNKYPDMVLDGELFIPGESLQYISGLVRKMDNIKEHDNLELHVYDLAIPTKTQEERTYFLENIIFNEFKFNSVKLVNSVKVNTDKEVKLAHDMVVGAGFEGLILREPSSEYGFDKRDNRMMKVKMFQEEEFKIIGIEEGERGSEDMVFICYSYEGDFKVKPMGTREQKQKYCEDYLDLIGMDLTVRYFEKSDSGIPIHAVGVTIRDYE